MGRVRKIHVIMYTLRSTFTTIAATIALSGALSAETTSLFNGKDLTGWNGDGYTVKEGVITCTPKGRNLTTEKEYENYEFEFEFKLPAGGNNGLGIHYPGTGDAAYAAMELQILDNTHPKYKTLKDYHLHGSVYKLQAAKTGHLKPVGEWNKQTVTVNGSSVTIELNGTIINEIDLDELAKKSPDHKGIKRRKGHICFCGHGDPVQFRAMKITELPATAKLPKLETEGFVKIYNGKDLTGWSDDKGHEGHWQPRGEVLHYDGNSKAKDKNLWTEKSYKDFTLTLDWRWASIPKNKKRMRPVLDPTTGDTKRDADGKPMEVEVIELDSGVYLRGNSKSQVNLWNWPCGSGEVYGYRMDRRFAKEIKAALTPKEKADNPLGQWNRMQITLKGDRLTVVLNGKEVISNAQLPGVPKEGPIALQHHGSALEFRNIMIKEH